MIYPLRIRVFVGFVFPLVIIVVMAAVAMLRTGPVPAAMLLPLILGATATIVLTTAFTMLSAPPPSHVRLATRPDTAEDIGTTALFSNCEHAGDTADTPYRRLIEQDRRIQELTCELEQAKRLADIGQLATGVAHELNNPLGGIIVYANLLLEDTEKQDSRRANIIKIIHESERCRKIVASLLDIARKSTPLVTAAEVNRLVEEALDNLRNEKLCGGIRFDTQLNADAGTVMCDSCQLQEVFENLIRNAAEAMDSPGTLTITSGREAGDTGTYWAVVRFADEGPGIPEENLEKIFEPFFSMKHGHGTGLGLSVSSAIVQRHGGTITAENRSGAGALFTVRIPMGGASS